MTERVQQLHALGDKALSAASPSVEESLRFGHGNAVDDLLMFLSSRNGFYALDSALHVFPAAPGMARMDLNVWNAPDTWRYSYGALADACLFFAEDIFGGQFCLWRGGIYSFDPETGEKTLLAASMDDWAGAVLSDPDNLTGWPLAREWQQRHGPIPAGMRLIPKQPFVLGGAFDVNNLYLLQAGKGMRFRGDIALQLRNVPDGSTVRLKTIK